LIVKDACEGKAAEARHRLALQAWVVFGLVHAEGAESAEVGEGGQLMAIGRASFSRLWRACFEALVVRDAGEGKAALA
jgi:hypothetical protein